MAPECVPARWVRLRAGLPVRAKRSSQFLRVRISCLPFRGRTKETPLVRSWRSWIVLPRTGLRKPNSGSDETKAPRTPDRGRPLRPLLFLYFTLALLPIAAVSIIQGIERARIDTANVHERLIQAARDAAGDENTTLAAVERLGQALADFHRGKGMV